MPATLRSVPVGTVPAWSAREAFGGAARSDASATAAAIGSVRFLIRSDFIRRFADGIGRGPFRRITIAEARRCGRGSRAAWIEPAQENSAARRELLAPAAPFLISLVFAGSRDATSGCDFRRRHRPL